MTNKLKDWSTTAASNNATPPNGWPEGMAPSAVNNSARQGMASVREWYEDAEWILHGHTIASTTTTEVVISGDVTAIYVANRAVRIDQNNAKVGHIVSSSYSAPNTTVTLTGVNPSGATAVEVGILSESGHLPNDLVVAASESAAGIAELATQAEVNAGTDDERIVTPLKVRSGFSINLAATGHIKLPAWMGGLVINWANVSATSTPVDHLYDLAFPNACFGGVCSISVPAGLSTPAYGYFINKNLSTFQIDSSSGTSYNFFVIAIGW